MSPRAWVRGLGAALLTGALACGGGPEPEAAAPSSEAAGGEPTDESVEPASSEIPEDGAAARGETPMPELVIPRPAMVAVVEGGLGRVLARFETEPHMDGNRLVGFRIVGMSPEWRSSVPLLAGDTVTRINGSPIARPEQAQQAFDGLRVASELVVEYMRAGEVRVLRYAIQ